MNLGTWTAIGAGIGAAIGSATHNIGVWLGVGVALGVGIGAAMNRTHRTLPNAPDETGLVNDGDPR